VRLVDLSEDRREPRGAIVADVVVEGGAIRTVVTHLGLRGSERRSQLERLIDDLGDSPGPTLLLADLNEWSNQASRLRLTHQFAGAAVRAFPASWPILPLDRILARPPSLLVRVMAHQSELARVASDHLPVWAELRPPG
jgi:endonuclease/exonuclease/phosphatase family metal-dependent hydrolase